MPLVYNELRRLARYHLKQQRPNHTLQTTALVHEAYLRLAQEKSPRVEKRAHCLGIAAQLMRWFGFCCQQEHGGIGLFPYVLSGRGQVFKRK